MTDVQHTKPNLAPRLVRDRTPNHASADVLCAYCDHRYDEHREGPYYHCPKLVRREDEWPFRVEEFVPKLARDEADAVADTTTTDAVCACMPLVQNSGYSSRGCPVHDKTTSITCPYCGSDDPRGARCVEHQLMPIPANLEAKLREGKPDPVPPMTVAGGPLVRQERTARFERQRCDNTRDELAVGVVDLQAEVAALRAERDEWRRQANGASDMLEACEAELEELKTQLIRANADVANCCDKRDDLAAELDGYRNGNRDLHAENQALRAERDELRAVHLSAEQEVHDQSERAMRAEAEVERLRPVVEAAGTYVASGAFSQYTRPQAEDMLRDAVDAYRAATHRQETPDAG